MPPPPLLLYVEPRHRPSLKVLRFVRDFALEDRVRLLSLTTPEVRAEWTARGGHAAPALWDGTHLHQGAEAVQARLMATVNLGRE